MPAKSHARVNSAAQIARDSFLPPADPAAYDTWFRAKVREALDDPRPTLSSEEVEAYFANGQ